jgi:chromosome segregation ATPase
MASSKQSASIHHDSRQIGLITAETIRNCIMDALASSSADELLRCLAGSEWTRDYALCRVGELIQDYLRPLIMAGSNSQQPFSSGGGVNCKGCKEKEAALGYYKQQASANMNQQGPISQASMKSLAKQLEDTTFTKEALEEQVSRLKEELQATADGISHLKADRVKSDIACCDWQKKVVEAQARVAKACEDAERAERDRETTLTEAEKIERLYKNERRRAANLERELEQLQYTYGQLHKNSSAEISSLREHISLLKIDNLSLTNQINTLSSEINSKADEEKKETIKIMKKLKELESQFDGLKILNDSLEKKVDFYKDQLMKSGNKITTTHFDYTPQEPIKTNHSQHEDSVQGSAKGLRSNPFESFSSFNNRRVKELNLEIREASADQFENLQKFTSCKQVQALKAENERLKIKLSTVLMQIKHLKELFKVELNTSRQELDNLKSFLFNSFQGLAQKVRLQSRRLKLLFEKESKSRVQMNFDHPPKFSRHFEENKENRYHLHSPSKRKEITDKQPSSFIQYHKDISPRSPLRDRSTKRGQDQPTTGSFKKLHYFGKQEIEEIETKNFRLTSPIRSSVARSPQRRWNPDETYIRNHSYQETNRDWEQLGNDIIQKLHRKF